MLSQPLERRENVLIEEKSVILSLTVQLTSREVDMPMHLVIPRAKTDVLLWPSALLLKHKLFVHLVISDVDLDGSWTPGRAVIWLEMILYFMMQCLEQIDLLCQKK